MNDNKATDPENDPLLKEASDLAEYIYGILHDLPEEERWNTEAKLRQAANDLMFHTALAIGNASPSNNEFDWGYVRKDAYALKVMYRFAARQKFLQLEPEIMIRLRAFIKAVNKKSQEAYRQTETKNKLDFERWRSIIEMQKEAGSNR